MNITINLNTAYISIQAARKFISSARGRARARAPHKFRIPFKYVLWTRSGWPRILSPRCEKVCATSFRHNCRKFSAVTEQNDKIVSRGIKFARGVWRWHYKRMWALPCKHAVSRMHFILRMRSATFRPIFTEPPPASLLAREIAIERKLRARISRGA